ncbi:ubiquitin-like protein 3b isoform 1-T1 [Anableps anableps]
MPVSSEPSEGHLMPEEVHLRLILVSGKTQDFTFSPNDSATDIAKHVFDHWPAEACLDSCDGASSCGKIIVFLKDADFFLNRCSKKGTSKNCQQVWELILTRKGPTSSSLITPAHTSTPPPPCWRLTRS